MSYNTFVHLHLHTEYSLANSVLRIKPLLARVAEMDMPAVAITVPLQVDARAADNWDEAH